MSKLLIIGAGGNGKVYADIAKKTDNYSEIVFLDDNNELKECNGYSVVGKVNEWIKYQDYDCIISFGDNKLREKISTEIELKMISLVHPSAVVSDSATIEIGCAIMPSVVINANATIKEGTIVNSGAIVEHDCIIEKFAHVSPGVKMGGGCSIGHRSWIGIGATISNNISIGAFSIIGAGAVVVKNISNNVVAYGVPAKVVNSI